MFFHHPYRFNLALTASLLLHLFFLFGIAIQLSGNLPVNPGQIQATLVSLEKQGISTAQNASSPAPEAIKKPAPTQKKRTEQRVLPKNPDQLRPQPTQQLLTQETIQTTRVHEAQATTPSAPAKTAAGESVATDHQTVLASASESNPGAQGVHHAASPTGGLSAVKGNGSPAEEARKKLDQQEVQQYRWHLGKAIKRFKRYPGLAKERGWEGNAEFSIDFAAMRHVPDIILKRSSGRELLDSQALEMIRQAINVTSLPENLRGHNFHIPLTVEFHLEEAS